MKRQSIYDVSARYMGAIWPAADPIWLRVQKSSRHDGTIYRLSRELAVKLRDCLDKALDETPDDAVSQLELRKVGEKS